MSKSDKIFEDKIRFLIMNNQVTNQDFNYFKSLFIECLYENPDITVQLDNYYLNIQICFFYEMTDSNVEDILRKILNDSKVTHSARPTPAFAQSRKNVGCIFIFVKHLQEYTQKLDDVEDARVYHKNGIFEEICHLVEQKGDSGVHPDSYLRLWKLYRNRNLLQYRNKIIAQLSDDIIAQLDTNRNHYEVYLMVINAYPNDWVKRCWKYFSETPETYQNNYEKWKLKFPIRIVYAKLITDVLRSINVLYVVDKVQKEKLSGKNKELLDALIKTGKLCVEKQKYLIERDIGSDALILIDSLDERIFRTPKVFFDVILDLWNKLDLCLF